MHRTASAHTREQSSSFSAYLPKNSRGTSEWVTRLKKCRRLRCHGKCLADYVFILSPVEIPKREGVTLEKVIEGDTPFGSWGDHLDAWQPLDRPRTLFLRFEDMTERPEKVIASMALFLKMEKQMEWANNIASLQKLYPGFFRSGNDALNKAEMDARHNALFESRYGLWLRRLGYLD